MTRPVMLRVTCGNGLVYAERVARGVTLDARPPHRLPSAGGVVRLDESRTWTRVPLPGAFDARTTGPASGPDAANRDVAYRTYLPNAPLCAASICDWLPRCHGRSTRSTRVAERRRLRRRPPHLQLRPHPATSTSCRPAATSRSAGRATWQSGCAPTRPGRCCSPSPLAPELTKRPFIAASRRASHAWPRVVPPGGRAGPAHRAGRGRAWPTTPGRVRRQGDAGSATSQQPRHDPPKGQAPARRLTRVHPRPPAGSRPRPTPATPRTMRTGASPPRSASPGGHPPLGPR